MQADQLSLYFCLLQQRKQHLSFQRDMWRRLTAKDSKLDALREAQVVDRHSACSDPQGRKLLTPAELTTIK